MIPNLFHLKKLEELWLYVSSDQLPSPSSSSSLLSMPPLTNVTNLHLEIFNISADQFFLHLPPLFPNIEMLTVKSIHFEKLSHDNHIRLRENFPRLQKYRWNQS